MRTGRMHTGLIRAIQLIYSINRFVCKGTNTAAMHENLLDNWKYLWNFLVYFFSTSHDYFFFGIQCAYRKKKCQVTKLLTVRNKIKMKNNIQCREIVTMLICAAINNWNSDVYDCYFLLKIPESSSQCN